MISARSTRRRWTAARQRCWKTSPASTDLYDYPHYVEYAINDVVDTFLDLNGLEDTSANRYAMENKLRTGGYSVLPVPGYGDSADRGGTRWPRGMITRACAIRRTRSTSPAMQDGTYTEIEQPQAAACVFDYRTGELKAIVGGRYKPTARKTLNRALRHEHAPSAPPSSR